MSWMTFMKEVIRENKTTGAFAPSSRELADAITDLAQLRGARAVAEYGPGNGVFTEVILQKLDPGAFFVSLEVNPHLVAATRKRCPRANVVQDSAANVGKYLREAGHDSCEVIISGLPWTRFGEGLQDEILNATHEALAPGGRFLTFAYAMSPMIPSGRRFLAGKLPAKFAKVRRVGPIWKNVPPCFVYIATK